MGEFTERHIFSSPPTREELAAVARLLPGGTRDLLSTRSTRARELGLTEEAGWGPENEEELLDLLAREPRLLRRPIVTDGRAAVVGYDEAALRAAFGGGAEGPQGRRG